MTVVEDIYQDEIDDLFYLLINTNEKIVNFQNDVQPNFVGNYRGIGQSISYSETYSNINYKNYSLIIQKIINSDFYLIIFKGFLNKNIIAIGNLDKTVSGNGQIVSYYLSYNGYINGSSISGSIIPQKIENGKIINSDNNFKIILQNSSNIQKYISNLQNYISNIQTTISNLQTLSPNIENNIINLQNCVANLETIITELKSEVSSNISKAITNLENAINSIQTSITNLQSSITDKIQTANNNLQNAITYIQSSVNNLIGSISTIIQNVISNLQPQPISGGITLNNLLNLSNILFNGNVNSYNFQQQAIATNLSGQYVTVVGNGGLYSSNDYGDNFTFINTPFNQIIDGYNGIYLFAVSMNSTGQYQMAVTSADGTTAGCNIYISSDYGSTWTATLTNITGNNYGRWFQSCCMSSDGSIMFAGGGGGAGLQNYFSTNYGQSNTWEIIGNIWNRPGCVVQNSTFILSTGGSNTYMTENIQTFGEILYSDNVDTTNTFRITCDNTGQFIAIITQNGSVSLSNNGGTSWNNIQQNTQINNIVYSSDASVLAMSSTNTLYISQTYGLSWSEFTYNNANGIFYFTMSANGKIIYLVDENNNLWSFNLNSVL